MSFLREPVILSTTSTISVNNPINTVRRGRAGASIRMKHIPTDPQTITSQGVLSLHHTASPIPRHRGTAPSATEAPSAGRAAALRPARGKCPSFSSRGRRLTRIPSDPGYRNCRFQTFLRNLNCAGAFKNACHIKPALN